MEGVLDLKIWQIAAAYVFAVIVFIIVKRRGISREKEIILATLRMTVQLILVGYVLVYLFENINPFITIGIVLIMEVFAIYNIYKRTKLELTRAIKKIHSRGYEYWYAFEHRIFFVRGSKDSAVV